MGRAVTQTAAQTLCLGLSPAFYAGLLPHPGFVVLVEYAEARREGMIATRMGSSRPSPISLTRPPPATETLIPAQ